MTAIEGMLENKLILDATCGGRMMWDNKKNPNTLYCDIRIHPPEKLSNRQMFSVLPDMVVDFRKMPFPDKRFKLVLWDPPHLKNLEENSWARLKFGSLNAETWQADIAAGFRECWRVLDDYGVLTMKWSEADRPNRRIRTEDLLKVLPVRPLYGSKGSAKNHAVWLVFMKIPDCENAAKVTD